MGIQFDGINNEIKSQTKIDFPGSVGVAGVLTYEDVTNVDSVGLITARTGIKIGPTAGVAGTFFADGSYVTAGVVTATTFYGSGANLTGISAGAGGDTGLDLNDNVKIRLGTGNDIEFYHSGSHNFIDITNGQLRIRHGTDNAIKTVADGETVLYYDGGQRIQTTTGGIEISGETVASSHIKLADNARLKLGTGEDCQFWHNGSHSMLKNQTGRLYILADDIWIKDQDDGDLHAKFVHDDAVELYHNNIKTFQTDGNGIMVYGPEGGTANVYIYADEGDDNADKFQLTVNDGGPFHIQNRKSGSVETNLKCYGDGAVELYHDNSKKLHTQSGGVNVEGQIVIDHTAGTDGKGEIAFGESGRPFIDGFDNGNHGSGAGFDFRAGNGDYFIKARQDAAVEIYHDNTKRLETTSSGTLFPAGTADFRGPSGTSYTVEVNPTYVNPYGLWCREPSSFNNGYPLLAVTNNGGQTYFRTLSGGTSEARNIQPVANNTYDLGTSSVRWRNIYTNDLNLSNEGSANDVDGTWGDWTLQEGESDLFLKNNRSGKKYKFNLTEVS